MGSTGSGRFSDYPGSRSQEGNLGEKTGGISGEDRCLRAFSCALEEIEHCDYFSANENVPAVNTVLFIEQRGRLVAVNDQGQSVGALPTRYNYLADCIAEGFRYEGHITASTLTPLASIHVDFMPRQT